MKKTSKGYLYFILISMAFYLLGGNILKFLVVQLNLNIGVANSISHFSIFIPGAILFILVTGSSFKEALNLRKTPIINLLLAVAMGMASYPLITFLANISQIIAPNDSVNQFAQQTSSIGFVGMFIAIAVTPAITEEITLRGIVLSCFNDENIFITAIINGILFGVFHNNSAQFLYAFVLGFIFALMVRYTGSILVSMICHLTINGTQVIISNAVLSNPKFSEEIAQAQQQITSAERASALITLLPAVVVSITLIVLILNKMKSVGEREALNRGIQDNEVIQENNNELKLKKGTWKLFINIWTILIAVMYTLLALAKYIV